MDLSRNAVGKPLERQCTLKGPGQPVLQAAHPDFCYLSQQEEPRILQVDVSSKALQQLPCPPRQDTNLKATAASPSKPWLSSHMGEEWCTYSSGWASAPLMVLVRTGWSSAMNSKCLLISVLFLWIKGLPKQTLLLTSLVSWHIETIWHSSSLTGS